MNTQNTPVHVKLWHHQFWYLALANLLLSTAACMAVPLFPGWMLAQGAVPSATAWALLAFGLGFAAQGCFCSFLVQRFRRHHVCQAALLLMSLSLAATFWLMNVQGSPQFLPASPEGVDSEERWLLLTALRMVTGAAYGMAQMVMMSTLIIDTTESFRRTEANHAATWFGRVGVALGPLLALLALRFWPVPLVMLASAACPLVAFVLVALVSFPFRAPEEIVKVCSFDRFFLPHATPLFLNFLLFTVALGILLSLQLTALFYAFMMAGFLLALLAQKFVFANAELKSEILSGLLLMAVALLLLLSGREVDMLYVSPVLAGLAVGIVGARFLLFFIKLSNHCQRGTSQSTYLLGWETGIALGLAAGYGWFGQEETQPKLLLAITFVAVAFVLYHFFTHSWYWRNKNR